MDVKITRQYIELMLKEGLGLDLSDPNLKDTADRISRMYVDEFFSGVGTDFRNYTLFPNEKNYDQIIMVDNVHFVAMCSHHFLPFVGKAYLLYIPDKHLVGVSKIVRAIEHYSAQPQLQENLTHSIIENFQDFVKPKGVMLIMRGIHGCMSCRGVNQYDNCGMVTSALTGSFKNGTTRNEAMGLITLASSIR